MSSDVGMQIAVATDEALAGPVAELINEAYLGGEKGLWAEGTPRTDEDEVRALIRAGQIVVALDGDELVGSVKLVWLDEETAEFGMLAGSPRHRNSGIGRLLVAYAEGKALESGRRTMRLELLVPREWSHPVKEFLLQWYTRLGYVHVRTGVLEEQYPQLSPHLVTACNYQVYHKAL
jgi:GNAT superfamily N-acetyltransferase